MSYIKSLKIATELFPDIELQNCTDKDLIRIEKLLKVEQKVNPDFKATSIGLFLKSLEENPEGVQFLFANPNLVHVINRNLGKLNRDEVVNLEAFDTEKTTAFVSKYLTEELTDVINYYFKKEVYQPVARILRYRAVLPEAIVALILERTDAKMDFITNRLDELIDNNPVYKESFFTLVETLNDEEINKKRRYFDHIKIKYSLNIATTRGPGIVVFFKILGNGIHWLSTKPKNIEEKIERKLAMEDFRFIGYFLIGFVVLIIVGVTIGLSRKAEEKQERREVAKEQFTKSMNGFLTEFDPAKAENIIYVDSVFKTGDNPYPKEYFRKVSDKEEVTSTKQYINRTEYDIIVMSNDEFIMSSNMKPYRFLLKSKDTFQGKFFMISHFYIGKDLALFNSTEKYIPPRYKPFNMPPRFLKPYKNSKAIIDMIFQIRGNMEFIQEGEDIIVTSDKPFSVNHIRGTSYKL